MLGKKLGKPSVASSGQASEWYAADVPTRQTKKQEFVKFESRILRSWTGGSNTRTAHCHSQQPGLKKAPGTMQQVTPQATGQYTVPCYTWCISNINNNSVKQRPPGAAQSHPFAHPDDDYDGMEIRTRIYGSTDFSSRPADPAERKADEWGRTTSLALGRKGASQHGAVLTPVGSTGRIWMESSGSWHAKRHSQARRAFTHRDRKLHQYIKVQHASKKPTVSTSFPPSSLPSL